MPPKPDPVQTPRKKTHNKAAAGDKITEDEEDVFPAPMEEEREEETLMPHVPLPVGMEEDARKVDQISHEILFGLRKARVSGGMAPSTKPHYKTDDDASDDDEDRGRKVPGKNNRRLPAKPWESHPNFFWAVQCQNPFLEKEFWPNVLPGIKQAAEKFSIKIDPEDEKWLQDHGGRFELFVHPQSTRGQKMLKNKKCHNLTHEEIDAMTTKKRHTRYLSSLRFKQVLHGGANTQEHCETSLRLFWNFLAMAGFYEDMLILLGRRPNNAPAITDTHTS